MKSEREEGHITGTINNNNVFQVTESETLLFERTVTGLLFYQLLVAVTPTLEQKGEQKELQQNTACEEVVRNPSASSKLQQDTLFVIMLCHLL